MDRPRIELGTSSKFATFRTGDVRDFEHVTRETSAFVGTRGLRSARNKQSLRFEAALCDGASTWTSQTPPPPSPDAHSRRFRVEFPSVFPVHAPIPPSPHRHPIPSPPPSPNPPSINLVTPSFPPPTQHTAPPARPPAPRCVTLRVIAVRWGAWYARHARPDALTLAPRVARSLDSP